LRTRCSWRALDS